MSLASVLTAMCDHMISATSSLDMPMLTNLFGGLAKCELFAHAPSCVQTNMANVIFLIMTTSGCAFWSRMSLFVYDYEGRGHGLTADVRSGYIWLTFFW